jgi:hypothetical protein
MAEGTYGNLCAYVGFDSAFGGHGVEAGCAVDTVAVGEGECRHFELPGALG